MGARREPLSGAALALALMLAVPLVAALAFVLAAVFEQGSAMRDELEGTV